MAKDGAPGPGTTKTNENGDESTSSSIASPSRNPFVQNIMDQRGSTEVDSSGDETTAFATRLRGGKRSYSTQDDASKSTATQGHSTRQDGSRQPESRSEPDRTTQQSPATRPDELRLGWWKTLVEKYGTIELENKGSVARDHLALERTFLAWLRTSLSFASIGIAITQLFRLNQTISEPKRGPKPSELRHVGKPVGVTFLAVGILVLLIGFHRYFESQHYVRHGKFPASRTSIALISLVSGALIFASLVVIVSIKPASVT